MCGLDIRETVLLAGALSLKEFDGKATEEGDAIYRDMLARERKLGQLVGESPLAGAR